MRPLGRFSFVGLALVLATALMAPIIAFAVVTSGTVEADLAARSSAERARAAAQATRLVDQEIEAIEIDLRLLSGRSEIQREGRLGAGAAMESALAGLLASERYSYIGVYDAASSSGVAVAGARLDQGRVVAAREAVFGPVAGALQQQVAQEDLYRQVLQPALAGQVVASAAFLVVPPSRQHEGDQWSVFVARPILSADPARPAIGAIVAAPRFQHLSERLLALATPGRTVSLITRDSRSGARLVILASTGTGTEGSSVIDIPDRARAFSGESGEARVQEGGAKVVAYSAARPGIDGQNWVITVSDDLAVTLGPERRLAEQLQIASLAGVALAGVLGVAVAFLVGLVERQRRALGKSLAENVQLVKVVEQKRAEVEAASQAKSRFLASMSHELRTPLNSIIGFSDLLEAGVAGPLNDTQREYVGDVVGSARHLLSLINDVLDLSKVEAGKLELRPEDLDLAATVEQVGAIMDPLARAKRIDLVLDVGPSVGIVYHDGGKVRQILLNLTSNAVKFTREGGQVTVAVRRVNEDVELTVRDTGIGLGEGDLTAIFEEFRQVDSTYGRTQQGTGLGLALVKRLVELMGGTIAVNSALGVGSTFLIVLPSRQPARSPMTDADIAPLHARN